MSGLAAVVTPRSAVRILLAAFCAVLILAVSGPVAGSPLIADLAQPLIGEAGSYIEGPSPDPEPEIDADGASGVHAALLARVTQSRRGAAARPVRKSSGPSPRGPPTHRR